jgi:hypothetical protein
VTSEDYNWGSLDDKEGEEELAEDWHPIEMLRRIRRIRAELRRLAVCTDVLFT